MKLSISNFKKIAVFLSVLSLAFELNIFQIAGSGVKLWMLAAITGGFLLLWDIYQKGFVQLKKSKILWLGLGLLFFSALGISNSPQKTFSAKQLIVLATLIVLGVFFELYIKKYRREVYEGLSVGILASSLFAVYQNVAFNLEWPNFEVMAARPNAFFPEPDWLGIYLVLGLVPFLAWTGKDRQDSKLPKPLKNKYLFYSFLIIAIVAIILTVARASWLALIAEMGVIAMFYVYRFCKSGVSSPHQVRGRPCLEQDFALFLRKGIYFVSLIVISLILIDIFHLSRFNIPDRFRSIFFKEHIITVAIKPETGEKLKIDLEEKDYYRNLGYQVQEDYVSDENVASREEKFTGAWETIRTHPYLGNGLGITLINTNFEHNANNLFLEWWASAGIGGLALILGLLIYLLSKGLLFLKSGTPYAAIILAGTAGFIIVNIFNASIFLAFAWFYLAWLLATTENGVGSRE